MNRIYLFGKIIGKSKLKYVIFPKLKVYIELVVQVASGYKYNCIVYEEVLDKINDRIKKVDDVIYAYIIGKGVLEKYNCKRRLYI